MTDSLWQHILHWLEQLWAAVTGCLPGQSNPNQVLPAALSKVRTTRPGRPQSDGHNVGLDSVIWQAQREQFLRHPSLRSKPSGHDELYQLPTIAYPETEKTPDRLGGLILSFAPAPSPEYTVSDWSHIERIASTLHPTRSLLPPRPSVPSVVITPSTPSGGSGSEDNNNASADLAAQRPIGSGSSGGVKSLSHSADDAFRQRSNQTSSLEHPVSRRVRDNSATYDVVRTKFRSSATTNTTRRSLTQVPRRFRGSQQCSVLRDLEKGFITSFSDLDSPPLSPTSIFRPDSSSTPRLPFRMSWSHAPPGPATPTSDTLPHTPTRCRATFPAWDTHTWGEPTSTLADRAFFDDPSYYTSTPPCKKRADGIFGVQRIREDYSDTPLGTFESSSIPTCSTSTPPPPTTPPALGTMLPGSIEESEYVPYTDVFDLDMYHLDSFRSSIIIETSYLSHRPPPNPPINHHSAHATISNIPNGQQTRRLSTNTTSALPSPDGSSRESVPLALLLAAHLAKTSSKHIPAPAPTGRGASPSASEFDGPFINKSQISEKTKRFAFLPVSSTSVSSGPSPGSGPNRGQSHNPSALVQAPESPALSLSSSSEGVHIDHGIKRYRDHYRPPHYSKPPRLCAGDPHGSGSGGSMSPKSGSGSSSPEILADEGSFGSLTGRIMGEGEIAGVGVAGISDSLAGQTFGMSMRGPVQGSPGSVAETDDSENEVGNANARDDDNRRSDNPASSSISDPDDTLLFIHSAYGMSPPHRHHRNRSISPHCHPDPRESRKNQSLGPPEHKPSWAVVRKFSVRNRGTDGSSTSGTSTTVMDNSSHRGRSGSVPTMHEAEGGAFNSGQDHTSPSRESDMPQASSPVIQIPTPPLPLPPLAAAASVTTPISSHHPRGPRQLPQQPHPQPQLRVRERERERPIVPVVIVSRYSAATDSPSSVEVDGLSYGGDVDGLTANAGRGRSGSGSGPSRMRPLVSLIPEPGSRSPGGLGGASGSTNDGSRSAGATRGQVKGRGLGGGRAFPVQPLINLNTTPPHNPPSQRFGRPLITLIPGAGPSGTSSQSTTWNQSRALSLAAHRNYVPFHEAVKAGNGNGGGGGGGHGVRVPVPDSSSVEALKAHLKETCDNFERSIYTMDDPTGATSPSASYLWEPIPF